jgi:hypothetical protein
MAKLTVQDWDTDPANNTDINSINIQGTAPVSNFDDALRNVMAQVKAGLDYKQVLATKTGNYTAVLLDNNAFHTFTGATPTLTLTAAATLGANWHYNGYSSGGPIIIDPNGSETINGATTYTVPQYCEFSVKCDGSAFTCIVNISDRQASTTLASATTTDLNTATSQNVTISGTTTITSFGTATNGLTRYVTASGAFIVTNNANIITVTGADMTTVVGDNFKMVGNGTAWVMSRYTRVSNYAYNTTTATTSGTSKDFTIPSGAKRITVSFSGVSTNGTSGISLQIGAGSAEATGYLNGTVNGAQSTTEFPLTGGSGAAAGVYHGHSLMTLTTSNSWVMSAMISRSDTPVVVSAAGNKTTSGALTIVRVKTTNGTDAFDLGAVTVTAEY